MTEALILFNNRLQIEEKMLSPVSGRELELNTSLYESADKYISRLVDWEDYIVGSYLALVCKYHTVYSIGRVSMSDWKMHVSDKVI